MDSGATPPRVSAAFEATAARSIAESDASAPPGNPSPRFPPIHSAIGVRAPDRITTSGSPLLDTVWLLGFEKVRRAAGPCAALDAAHGAVDAARAGPSRR